MSSQTIGLKVGFNDILTKRVFAYCFRANITANFARYLFNFAVTFVVTVLCTGNQFESSTRLAPPSANLKYSTTDKLKHKRQS